VSLTVPPDLLDKAEKGEPISDDEFLACVADSLPYAWKLLLALRERLDGETPFVDNTEPPANEEERAQLLRFVGSDAMRGAAERKLGVKIAFQNCHRLAVFPASDGEPGMESGAYLRFVSTRAQLLNQSPEFVNC
jgi:hypothetical protein